MVFNRSSKLVFQRRLPSETLVGVSPPFAARTLELRKDAWFSVLEQLWPRSITPYFCCLKEKGSGFPLTFTAYPNSEVYFSWYEDASVALPGPSRLPLVQPCFQTFSISLPECGWPWLPQDFKVQGAREEPWTGAQEAIPSQFCDINQNYVT